MKKLNFWESILFKKCLNKNSIKYNIDNIEKCIQSKLSVNYFIEIFRDFENLKNVVLDEKKSKLFEYMKVNTIDQELIKLNEMPKELFLDDLALDDEEDKRIIERLNIDLLFPENC